MKTIEDYIPVLLTYLDEISPISEAIKAALTKQFRLVKFSKGELLLKEGEVCKHLWFLANGLLRSYHYIGEKEVTSRIMFTSHIVISAGSFFTQTPATETIEALDASLVLVIDFEGLTEIYKQFPEFNYHGRIITEQYFYKQEQRLYMLRQKSAVEKYKYFMIYYAQFMATIPQKFIASFLNINPETLSRIRQKQRQ